MNKTRMTKQEWIDSADATFKEKFCERLQYYDYNLIKSFIENAYDRGESEGRRLSNPVENPFNSFRDALQAKILLLTVDMDYAGPEEWKILKIKYDAWAEVFNDLTDVIGDGPLREEEQS